jgi:hypothetical protein
MKFLTFPLFLIVFASSSLASNVAILTPSLPNGTVELRYAAGIRATGGCTPYTWAVVSGALPTGVTRKSSGSTTSLGILGTPTTAASYSFTVSVTDCGKHVVKASYKIVIQDGSNHVVDLSWKPSTTKDVVGYNVYRGPDGATWKRINVSTVASTLYSDSTVANNTTYYYAATAVDIYGHESRKTPTVEVLVP